MRIDHEQALNLAREWQKKAITVYAIMMGDSFRRDIHYEPCDEHQETGWNLICLSEIRRIRTVRMYLEPWGEHYTIGPRR